MTTSYVLLKDRFEHDAGLRVYRFIGYDYGFASEDSRNTGVEHINVTFDSKGDYPFFTVPITDLKEVAEGVETTSELISNRAFRG